ncbi:hypothetical protein EV1_003189 [Malus domestica]
MDVSDHEGASLTERLLQKSYTVRATFQRHGEVCLGGICCDKTKLKVFDPRTRQSQASLSRTESKTKLEEEIIQPTLAALSLHLQFQDEACSKSKQSFLDSGSRYFSSS